MSLNMYMGWSGSDPSEGAALIFAHTAREARKVFWRGHAGEIAGDEFTDMRVTRIRDKVWLWHDGDAEKQLRDEAHVVIDPKACECCGFWGHEQIGGSGKCGTCEAERCDDTAHV